MNADTVTLIERPYQEVVDDILTAMVGGVVNEPMVFDVKEDHFPLSRVASDVRGEAVACGHYIAEEAPDALLAQALPFLREGL